MTSRLLFALQKAVRYAKNHPQILFVLVLVILIPLLFLYTGQQFLDAGKANQDQLQKDRIGIVDDALSALLLETNFDPAIARRQLSHVATLNPDIIDYMVSKSTKGQIVPFVAESSSSLTSAVTDSDLYRNASIRTDTSLIFESSSGGIRYWSTYRAIEAQDGSVYFLYLKFSMQSIDQLFAQREQGAYFSLIFIYLFMIALAIWHIKLTDYRYLYMKAQKASKTKDMFTNMIAHELRAPLTAIRGYAAMLEEKAPSDELKKYSIRVRLSAERLIVIVNDLLDVARIQSGKLSIETQETDIAPIVGAVTDELRISAAEKHIELNIEAVASTYIALCDPKRLHQAITNLISNAIKYTPQGTITLALEDKHAVVELRIKDTGMGISADDQKKLFAPFFRVSSADVTQITGSGLGMWITKELIELMGGTIAVESIKGIGTHVVVTLPKSIRIS